MDTGQGELVGAGSSRSYGGSSTFSDTTIKIIDDYQYRYPSPLDPESDIDLTGQGSRKPLVRGTIHPFHKSHSTVIGAINDELRFLFGIQNVRLACLFIFLNCVVCIFLSMWASSTNSLALRSYSYIVTFEILGLFTYVLSAWIVSQDDRVKPNAVTAYTLGFQRLEVLSVFSSVVISQIGVIFIIKESIERFLDQPEIHAGRLLPGALLAFVFHITMNYCLVNKAFQSIGEVASSSWIQEHVAEMSKGLCGIVPTLESFLLPRVNPFFLVSASAFCGVLLVDIALQINYYYIIDTLVGLAVSLITIGTLWPLASCSGRVLLNTTPSYILGQLDKLLSEAQTLDGVLEIKSDKFCTLAMGVRSRRGGNRSISMAGSLKVRVRRDADEQMVLAHVTNRLSSLVTYVTIQVLKDDWSAPSLRGLPAKAASSIGGTNRPMSYFVTGFNKPAVAVAPYLQTPPRKHVPSSVPSSNLHSIDKTDSEPRNDFNFSSPTKLVMSHSSASESQTNIAKMYKAARFVLPRPNLYDVHGDELSHLPDPDLGIPPRAAF